MTRKNPAAVQLGRLGGLKGGKSKSKAKVAAGRKNAAKARAAKLRPTIKLSDLLAKPRRRYRFEKVVDASYKAVYSKP